jgi:metal-responsive CopG/Arc/MetJ family transcriptional regulator
MSTIQLVLEDELLAKTDARAAQNGGDRSAVIREALISYLRRQEARANLEELEEQERLGYERIPDTVEDDTDWEKLFEDHKG